MSNITEENFKDFYPLNFELYELEKQLNIMLSTNVEAIDLELLSKIIIRSIYLNSEFYKNEFNHNHLHGIFFLAAERECFLR